jgi:hypothetical protein
MGEELETAGAISLGGLFRRGKHAETLPIGSPCPNCKTKLEGPWCYHCGQLAEDFHRSAFKLLTESINEFLDLDNRIWRTVPDLLIRPGRLTRSYLDGQRAPQVPPLRLFLIVLLALFLVGLNLGNHTPPNLRMPANKADAIKSVQAANNMSAADKKELEHDINVEFDNDKDAAAQWLTARVKNAIAHQSEFWQAVQNWAERFAVLMLPLSAILLSLLFAFQKKFYLFDHIIFSMHSLSFVCLLLTGTILWDHYLPLKLGGLPLLAAPVHLFFHMRGVYGTGVFGTLVRMFLLLIGSIIGAAFIVLGLLWVALVVV